MRSSFIVQTYAGDQVTPSLENTRARCQKERLQPCLQCIGVVASLGLSIVISFFVGTGDWVIPAIAPISASDATTRTALQLERSNF